MPSVARQDGQGVVEELRSMVEAPRLNVVAGEGSSVWAFAACIKVDLNGPGVEVADG